MPYDHNLEDGEKRELLRIARATLREFLRTGRIPPGKPHREALCKPAAVFVTLHEGESLRGCVGTLEEEAPLYKAIQNMAVAAATRDSRFEPVTGDELDELTLEISVLSNHTEIPDPGQLVIGTHGVRVTNGASRGLLLPQVAEEHSWDPETFVAHACKKAGLAESAWKDDQTTLESFTAQVFNETTHPAEPPLIRPQ